MEQVNELGAKNEEAGKTETRSVKEVHPSSNPNEDKLEKFNETGTRSGDKKVQ